MSFWHHIAGYIDPVQGIINATSSHPSQNPPPAQTNPTTGGTSNAGFIDPTIDATGQALTPDQLNALYGNSVYRKPSSHIQDFTPQGYPTTPLNTDQSNLYNALMDFYRNTPQSVLADETAMAKQAGTYGDTKEFGRNLNASADAAIKARGQILSQRADPLYASAGLEKPAGGLTREIAHQDLIKLATQPGSIGIGGGAGIRQGVPTTFSGGPMSATGFTGYAGTDYATQLQSLLQAYANLPGTDQAAAAAMGGNRVQTQQSQSALDQLQRYQLQQQANYLRSQLGIPASPAGSI